MIAFNSRVTPGAILGIVIAGLLSWLLQQTGLGGMASFVIGAAAAALLLLGSSVVLSHYSPDSITTSNARGGGVAILSLLAILGFAELVLTLRDRGFGGWALGLPCLVVTVAFIGSAQYAYSRGAKQRRRNAAETPPSTSLAPPQA